MQMYSVSARNLYRISPWYRLKPPLYLIFRKTDRTGQGCPCPCCCQFYHPTPLKDAGWSRTVPAPPLTDWLEQSAFHWGHRAIVNNARVRLQSSSSEERGARSIRKYSQQAAAGKDIFSGTKVVLGDCWMCSSFIQLNVGVGQPTQLTPTRWWRQPSINYENRAFYTKLFEKVVTGCKSETKTF